MREIIFDTETTGIDPSDGHRVVEIGCIETVNTIPTGRTYHQYINPERDMPEAAFAVHGLASDFLQGHPTFAEVAADFLDFIDGARLVAHNADFDIRFINAELARLGFPGIGPERIVDTLAMARQRFPGSPATLDALCRRFEIDNSRRTRHGALLDAELLAEVYLELSGGRQTGLALVAEATDTPVIRVERVYREPRPHAPTPEESAAHAAFIATMKDSLWRRAEKL